MEREKCPTAFNHSCHFEYDAILGGKPPKDVSELRTPDLKRPKGQPAILGPQQPRIVYQSAAGGTPSDSRAFPALTKQGEGVLEEEKEEVGVLEGGRSVEPFPTMHSI